MDPPRWPRDTLYPKNLALTLPTSGGRSVGIVRSPTKASELVKSHETTEDRMRTANTQWELLNIADMYILADDDTGSAAWRSSKSIEVIPSGNILY
jgi:hypothetical protein